RDPSLFIRQVKSAVFEGILKDLLGENGLKKEGDIDFTIDAKEAFEKVKAGLFQIAFFLPPADIEEIKKVSLAGKKMPPKSTFFYPKLLSGIVIRDMEDAV
ncbi:DUF1015 family protein, partial [Candidatus Aerophobetes bacterium]|nr:DUF1015 family protein [Candidatus Aerophobetes bacterium]